MGHTKLNWVAFACLTAACSSDHQASVNLPREPIAAGAYFPLSVSDSCSGGGKINFCTSESVVSIDSIEVDDPRVAGLLPMDQFDEALRVAYAELVVDAKRTGSTSLKIDATFDDGSQRKLETELVVQKADHIEVTHGCSVREPDDSELFPSGHEVPITVELLHRAQPLKGEYQSTLLEGAGLRRLPGLMTRNVYVWTAREQAGAVSLTSPPFPTFSKTYRTYARADLSIDSVARKYQDSNRYHTFVAFDVELTVDGKQPCEASPLRLETQTPEVCDGPEGALSWLSENPAYGVSVRALNSGTCSFTVGVAGSDSAVPVDVELDVTDIPQVLKDPCEDAVCDPIASCPDGSELSTRECCPSCVPVPNPALCEDQRAVWDELYQAELEDATACKLDADCGRVVLLGGCRRYCFVSVNNEQTTDFMNAISEDYYTSCPSCQVTQPVDCTGSGDVLCDAGRCRVR